MNGEWIDQAMARRGLDGPALATMLTKALGRNFTRSTISNMRHGRSIKADELLTIAKLTGQPLPGMTLVPHVSWVSAGKLRDSDTQVEHDVPHLPLADLGQGEFVALTVEGDSMDRVSPPGSIVVVNRADRDLQDGLFYVFWTRREGATFKRWRPFPARLEPYSTNPTHNPIYLLESDEPEVVGRVVVTTLEL